MAANEREHEIMEIVMWMVEYPVIIERMLNSRGNISMEECVEILETLEKQQLEYLIPIFIYVIRMFYNVDDSISKIISDIPIGAWLFSVY